MGDVLASILTIIILIWVASSYTEENCKGLKITFLGYAYMCVENNQTGN